MAIFRLEPPITAASNAGGVGKKRDSGRIYGFAAYRSTVLSTVRVAICEKQSRDERRQASSTPRRPSSVVRTRRRRSVCDRLDVIRRKGDQTPPGHNTLGHNPPFSAAVEHRRTEPGGYFVKKLTLTRTPDPIRPTRRGPDPNRPTNGSKQGGVCPGGRFDRTPPETIGDSNTEFNRTLCTNKSSSKLVI